MFIDPPGLMAPVETWRAFLSDLERIKPRDREEADDVAEYVRQAKAEIARLTNPSNGG